jgi:ABC-2 type transport system ATP-binding protein
MTRTISVADLTRRYRGQLALDHVTLDLDGPCITGLLGRNGAGKSTLMRILNAQELPSSGQVRVLGSDPWENDAVLRRMVFIREDQAYPDIRVGDAVQVASWFYPAWDRDLAEALLDDFALPRRRAIKKLSRGMRSALGIVIGLAAQAEVTLFDEPYAGLDAVARQLFYDRLLANYAEHPRTVLLSTHLIDEAADLLERVVMIDRGRVVLDAPADEVRGGATTVSGPTAAVDAFVAGRAVWERRQLASQASVIVVGVLDRAEQRRAGDLQLFLEPLSLQQMVVHAASRAVHDHDPAEHPVGRHPSRDIKETTPA